MDIFHTLLLKLIPLYLTIALGFVAARVLGVKGDNISKVLIYLVVPLVFFHGVLHTPLSPGVLFLPVMIMGLSSLLCLAYHKIGGWFYQDASRNILAMSAGNGNTGYFGLPVAILLFDEATVGIYLMAIMGVVMYENTLGFYITARGHHTAREALLKLTRLPALYACIAGLLMNWAGWDVPDFMGDFFQNMRGCYTVMGMMIVGLGLASITSFKLDWRFIALSFSAKFLAYPLLVLAVIALDKTQTHWMSEAVYGPLILMSIVPLAANTVVFATLLKAEPEKMASAVFLSTVLAAITVPLMVSWFI